MSTNEEQGIVVSGIQIDPPRPAERVASLYRRNGYWHGEITGPGKAWCATSNRSIEAVVSFIVRRLLASGTGICATGCEER